MLNKRSAKLREKKRIVATLIEEMGGNPTAKDLCARIQELDSEIFRETNGNGLDIWIRRHFRDKLMLVERKGREARVARERNSIIENLIDALGGSPTAPHLVREIRRRKFEVFNDIKDGTLRNWIYYNFRDIRKIKTNKLRKESQETRKENEGPHNREKISAERSTEPFHAQTTSFDEVLGRITFPFPYSLTEQIVDFLRREFQPEWDALAMQLPHVSQLEAELIELRASHAEMLNGGTSSGEAEELERWKRRLEEIFPNDDGEITLDSLVEKIRFLHRRIAALGEGVPIPRVSTKHLVHHSKKGAVG